MIVLPLSLFCFATLLFSLGQSLFHREVRPIVVLPSNWPTGLPIYQVKAFDNITGSSADVTYRLIKPNKLVNIDGKLGTVYLTSPLSTDEIQNIAVSACLDHSECAIMYITIETVDQNFCEQGYKKERIMYQVFENMDAIPLGPAMNDLMSSCNVLNSTCQVRKGKEAIFIKNGIVYSSQRLDREWREKINFTVQCLLEIEGSTSVVKTSHKGFLTLLDEDDSPPQFQGKTTIDKDITIQGFLPRKVNKAGSQLHFHNPLVLLDNDGLEVNKYSFEIIDDDLQIFEILSAMFTNDGKTIIGLNVLTRKDVEIPNGNYSFGVVATDTTLLNETNNAIRITVGVFETPEDDPDQKRVVVLETPEKDYQIDVYRPLTLNTRLFHVFRQPVQLNSSSYYFELLFANRTRSRGVQVTLRTGILYVAEPQYLLGVQRLDLILRWSRFFDNQTRMDTSSLGIQFHEHFQCPDESFVCSTIFQEEKCQRTCGLGAVEGNCQWKPQNASKPDMNYATCSPDVETCPDRHCDELEELDPRLCPQDCTEDETMGLGTLPHYSTQKGIQKGHGTCSCDEFLKCSCYPNMHNGPLDMDSEDENNTHPEDYSLANMEPFGAKTVDCDSTCVAIVVVGVVFTLIACVLGGVIIHLKRKKKENGSKAVHNNSISLSVAQSSFIEEQSPLYTPHLESFSNYLYGEKEKSKWLFPKNRLHFLGPLGEGEFSQVLKAHAYGLNGREGATTVAVKMLKDRLDRASFEDLRALKAEFALLKDLSHPNVIRLLGICIEKDYPCIIMEYCELGSLKNYLRNNRPISFYTNLYFDNNEDREKIRDRHLLSFAWQIAKGMTYLSDMKLVHRDLASRNVLLNANKTCKISDFGLTRDIYEADKYLKKSRGKVPVKWMALESIRDNIYTVKSDIWSFGIVLWELWTYGSSPYPGVSPERMYKLLCEGYRMECPKDCPAYIYELMMSCWMTDPNERPTFHLLKEEIDEYIASTAQYLDLEFLSAHNMTYQLNVDNIPLQDKSKLDSEVESIEYSTMVNLQLPTHRHYENVASSDINIAAVGIVT